MPRTSHLSAFFATMQAPQTVSVMAAVADQAYNTQNSRVFLPENRRLVAGFAGGVALTLAQLDSASLIQNGRPNIVPVDGDAAGGNLSAMMWSGDYGLTLPRLEQIGIMLTIVGVANSDMFGALWHTGGVNPAPISPVRTVHATAAATPAKGVWGLSQLTFDTQLAVGKYNVVGMTMYGANTLFGRLVFPNQVDRPGCLSSTAFTNYLLPYFRYGSQGIWGTFDNYNPPQIEVLGTGVPTTQDVLLDLQQVG